MLYINLPVIDMRESPSPDSKVVSQGLFAERIESQKEEGGWTLAKTSDGYSGWIPSSSAIKRQTPYKAMAAVTRLKAHIYRAPEIEYGPLMTLPYGAALAGIERLDARWSKAALPDGKEGFIQNGDISPEKSPREKWDLPEFGMRFLGLPYTWGGRSSFGYDCSGFAQMLYAKIGIGLQRDARQQILDTRLRAISISELEPGDLIFWGKSEERIMHVGMYIGEGKFIHASSRENLPWCRISHLTDPEWGGYENAYFPFRAARGKN